MVHNGIKFKIVRYYADMVVIQLQALVGGYLEGAEEDTPSTMYVYERVNNFDGGFEEWVKDNY